MPPRRYMPLHCHTSYTATAPRTATTPCTTAAIIVMRVAFDKVVGISVDTHVHRIANQACDYAHAHAGARARTMHAPCTRHARAMHTPCTRHARAMHAPCTRLHVVAQLGWAASKGAVTKTPEKTRAALEVRSVSAESV